MKREEIDLTCTEDRDILGELITLGSMMFVDEFRVSEEVADICGDVSDLRFGIIPDKSIPKDSRKVYAITEKDKEGIEESIFDITKYA